MTRLLLGFVSLAAAGVFWLTQQSPGHEFTIKNRLVHLVAVHSDIDIDFSDMEASMTESRIQERFAELDLDCGKEPLVSGDRSCYAPVRTVNGIDAWFVVFFFEKGELVGVKVDLRPSGHDPMGAALQAEYGEPHIAKRTLDEETINQWHLRDGVLMMNRLEYDDALSMVFWASIEALMRGRTTDDE